MSRHVWGFAADIIRDSHGSEGALKQAFETVALMESVEGVGFLVLIGLILSLFKRKEEMLWM